MEDDKISNKDLLNIIKHGHAWPAEKIKEVLEKTIKKSADIFGHHDFSYDFDDKYHFIYDSDCTLFIFDGKIEIRCDRDVGPSANKTYTRQIKEEKDIPSAYQLFRSVIVEDEES